MVCGVLARRQCLYIANHLSKQLDYFVCFFIKSKSIKKVTNVVQQIESGHTKKPTFLRFYDETFSRVLSALKSVCYQSDLDLQIVIEGRDQGNLCLKTYLLNSVPLNIVLAFSQGSFVLLRSGRSCSGDTSGRCWWITVPAHFGHNQS